MHSLQALAHMLLLSAQNLFQLCFAEAAYTAEDVPLALKTYLWGCANNGFAWRFVST